MNILDELVARPRLMTDFAHFLVGGEPRVGALETYLDEQLTRTSRNLPASQALNSFEIFQGSLTRAISRCNTFLANLNDRQRSILMLGKVQSGKTANLMGMLAWASDSEILVGVIFTGTTGSLNDQTYKRVLKDLGALPGEPIKTFVAPTARSTACRSMTEEIAALAMARLRFGPANNPLPVVVSMKNKARIGGISNILSAVAEAAGSSATFLCIDDEADQASQNSRAHSRELAATYSAMAGLRKLPMRNLWLSYTATPQAVLLTDRFGELRPDYVSLVPPRQGYFGLDGVTAESFRNQRNVVMDVRTRARNLRSVPESLINALYSFSFSAWVRHNSPDSFYANSNLQKPAEGRPASTQMLIHESGNVVDHERMYRLVKDEWDRLIDQIEAHLARREDSDDWGFHRDRMNACIGNFIDSGAPVQPLQNEFWSPSGQLALLELLQSTRLIVVNSDQSNPTANLDRPVDDSDYAGAAAWIIIGGDIMGRGITVPQLTTSYFLRLATSPNLDTVLQQLRFCGYRLDYLPWIQIYAPPVTFDDLNGMDVVERIVWNRAQRWDLEDRHLQLSMPAVFYVSPPGARFSPTRRGVQDPDIADRRVNGEVLFQAYDIFNPSDFRKNVAVLREWQTSWESAPDFKNDAWLRFDESTDNSVSELLTSWAGNEHETGSLEAVSELFTPEMAELGLSEIPRSIYVSRSLSSFHELVDGNVEQFLKRVNTTRSVKNHSTVQSWANWISHFNQHRGIPSGKRVSLAVAQVGAGQRSLRNKIDHIATTIIIEPILGLTETRNRGSAVALGVGMAILSPGNHQIRSIGHK